jgi:prefoldin subunit 5
VRELDPRWYAEQRQALQAQIDADEEQIRETQAIRQTGDGITGAIPLDKQAPGLNPEATVEILQNQVAQLEAQIDDLQDLARRNGIDPAVVR